MLLGAANIIEYLQNKKRLKRNIRSTQDINFTWMVAKTTTTSSSSSSSS
jgi:hypothetical protein